MQSYILPNGETIVLHDETLHRNAPIVTYTLKGGQVVEARRADLTPLAAALLIKGTHCQAHHRQDCHACYPPPKGGRR